MEVTAIDAAYAAGFFDGEGCLHIYKYTPRRQGGYWHFRTTVTNTDKSVIEWFQSVFGGCVDVHSSVRMPSHKSHWKTSYVWVASGHEAYAFLRVIEPYVKVKRTELVLGLAYGTTLKDRTKGELLSHEEHLSRDRILEEMYILRGRTKEE